MEKKKQVVFFLLDDQLLEISSQRTWGYMPIHVSDICYGRKDMLRYIKVFILLKCILNKDILDELRTIKSSGYAYHWLLPHCKMGRSNRAGHRYINMEAIDLEQGSTLLVQRVTQMNHRNKHSTPPSALYTNCLGWTIGNLKNYLYMPTPISLVKYASPRSG